MSSPVKGLKYCSTYVFLELPHHHIYFKTTIHSLDINDVVTAVHLIETGFDLPQMFMKDLN